VPAVRLDALLERQGWSPEDDVHFLLVDVEGAEREVLRSIDLRRWRPWVLVVEATAPNSTRSTHDEWEPDVLAAGYEFRLFDGLSRYYVSSERAAELGPALSYPACVLDGYQTAAHVQALEAAEEALVQATHWRTVALRGWADAVAARVESAPRDPDADRLRQEVAAMQQTLSWRVTRPLRGARRLAGRVRHR
jgi:methyltransferase FkbM-like protein